MNKKMATELVQNVADTKKGSVVRSESSQLGRWLGAVGSVLSSAVAIVCPLCIPALASLLAAAGLGFAVSTAFLRPLLIAMLLVSIGSFTWSAKLHGRWWILGPALIGSLLIYSGRYIWFSQPLMWAGAAILIGTSLLNFKIKRSCSRCGNIDSSHG